jgi:uncharacterized protein
MTTLIALLALAPTQQAKFGPIEEGLKRRERPVNEERLYQLNELEVVNLTVGKNKFYMYVMDTDSKMMEGMMHLSKSEVSEDEAMIFAYPRSKALSFWMRNTRIDLDIVFLNEKYVSVNVETMKAFDETGTPSRGAAKYAVEFLAGTCKKLGIKPGMKFEFSPKVKYIAE